MRICYVVTTVHLSKDLKETLGSTTHTYSIASELQKLGHQVFIISERFKNDKKHEIINGLHVFRFLRAGVVSSQSIKKSSFRKLAKPFKFIPNFLLSIKIAKFIEKYDCDLILERNHSLGVGAIASYLTLKPLILESIDYIYNKLSVRRAKKIIAYTKKFFPVKYHKKIFLVTAGYDPCFFYPTSIYPKYDICYAGSFKEWDGVENLIKVIAKLNQQNRRITALLIGQGNRFEKIKNLITKYNLQSQIKLLGQIPLNQVAKHIAQSKICLASYNIKNSPKGEFQKYGFYYSPLKIFEYLACGKPILASNYSKIKNILVNANSKFFMPGDTQDMAQKIIKLLDQQNINKISQTNLELAKNYTWAKIVQKLNKEILNSI